MFVLLTSCFKCILYLVPTSNYMKEDQNLICLDFEFFLFFLFFSIQKRNIYKTKKDNTKLNTRDKKSYRQSTAHKVNKNKQ